ncbi:MAG: Na/Pi symporter [Erysipelotrichaceae bacterium]|nr:Na/Pi symporter [Erysipelotrichaceae bacterium]
MSILSGLSLFLYGMHLMSQSLEICMNDYMKHVLMSFTKHKYVSLMIGMILTAMMQSSSAMTIMLMSCLNSHLISLESAIWLLMGANIGTTITGHIMSLDMSQLAPILAIIGIILLWTKLQTIGEVIIGLGLLFIGLEILQLGLSSIHIDMFLKVNHPMVMIIYGFILTSIIQSSSASIGILQSLVVESLIPFSSTVYLIFGFNMGSCMTGILASIVSSRDAKRLALFHLLINGIGTILFYMLCNYTLLLVYFKTIIVNPVLQVAYMHTFFNVITTFFVILIYKYFIRLIYLIFPDKHTFIHEKNKIRIFL